MKTRSGLNGKSLYILKTHKGEALGTFIAEIEKLSC